MVIIMIPRLAKATTLTSITLNQLALIGTTTIVAPAPMGGEYSQTGALYQNRSTK